MVFPGLPTDVELMMFDYLDPDSVSVAKLVSQESKSLAEITIKKRKIEGREILRTMRHLLWPLHPALQDAGENVSPLAMSSAAMTTEYLINASQNGRSNGSIKEAEDGVNEFTQELQFLISRLPL